MTDYMTNVVHPSFSNLQIETYYDDDLDILVASKRKKNEEDTDLFVYTKLIGIDLDKEVETEKQKIIKILMRHITKMLLNILYGQYYHIEQQLY